MNRTASAEKIPAQPPLPESPPAVKGALLAAFLLVAAAQAPVGAQTLPPEKQTAFNAVEALASEIRGMSMSLWSMAETALREHESADLLIAVLEEQGFAIERGVAGMPTAFVASYGSGEPSIGILAEYDALPGVGNEAVPRRQARDDGTPSGHGCGHNLFAAGSVGAALALKHVIDEHGLDGTIRLFGTPAEETLVGKVYMAKAGLFDDLDVALEWHPTTETQVRNQPGRAMNNFEVEFFGQAAHGSSDPWNGRSALDAVELMNHAVNMMREHVMPTTRIHYVIPNAGEAPNVVPEYARAWYFVRDVDRESVENWYGWMLDIAEAAARATRVEHKSFLITGVHSYRLNRPLLEALQANLEYVGAPPFSEEEQEFARELQRFLEIEEAGYNTHVKPLADEPEPVSGGSTDVAEVSHIVPTAGVRIATAAEGVPWHSWASTACHGTEAGVKGAVVAAKTLAMTGVDLLTDGQLLDAAKAAFIDAGGDRPYVSPLPPDQDPPLPSTADR